MRLSAVYAAAAVMLSSALAFATWSQHRPPQMLAQPLESIPMQIGAWKAVENPALSAGALAKLVPTSYLSRTYSHGSTTLDLFIAYYAAQRAGESMHSPKHCLPGAGWEIWQHGTATVPVGSDTVRLNQFRIQKETERAQTIYWYQSQTRIIAAETSAKMFLVWDGLTKGHTEGSIVRIVSADNPTAVKDAESFASLIIPQVDRCLGAAMRR